MTVPPAQLSIRSWLIQGNPYVPVRGERGQEVADSLSDLIGRIRSFQFNITILVPVERALLQQLIRVNLDHVDAYDRDAWLQTADRIGDFAASVVYSAQRAIAPRSMTALEQEGRARAPAALISLLEKAVIHNHFREMDSLTSYLSRDMARALLVMAPRNGNEIQTVASACVRAPFEPLTAHIFIRIYPSFLEDALHGVYDRRLGREFRQALSRWSAPQEGYNFIAQFNLVRVKLREEKHLNLSNLRLKSIPDVLHMLPHVETVDLSRNDLQKLPRDTSHWSNVKILDVAQNPATAGLVDVLTRIWEANLDITVNLDEEQRGELPTFMSVALESGNYHTMDQFE